MGQRGTNLTQRASQGPFTQFTLSISWRFLYLFDTTRFNEDLRPLGTEGAVLPAWYSLIAIVDYSYR